MPIVWRTYVLWNNKQKYFLATTLIYQHGFVRYGTATKTSWCNKSYDEPEQSDRICCLYKASPAEMQRLTSAVSTLIRTVNALIISDSWLYFLNTDAKR